MQERKIIVILSLILYLLSIMQAQSTNPIRVFDFSGEFAKQPQFFVMESQVITYAPDGSRKKVDIYEMYLRYNPSSDIHSTE